ncbi:MAG: hypothetical protein Q9166_001227 [cf. Caloplaca sp. 2 TL-2023]
MAIESNTIDEVEKLYEPESPQHISQIQDALHKIQRSEHGWQLADALLTRQDEKIRFFGALTFTIKINVDWDSLKAEDTGPLLHRLLQLLTLRTNAGDGALVTKKLCTALVAYFLRPSVSWDRCLLHLVCCLGEGNAVSYEQLMSSSYTEASQVVQSLEKPQLLTALWFATTLVEEVGKTSSANIRTHKYHEKVQHSLNDAVQLMQAAIAPPKPGSDNKPIKEGIKCFQSWVIYAQGAWIDKALELTQMRTLLPNIAQPLWDEDLFEVAADCWTELMTTFPAFFAPENLVPLVEFLTDQKAQNLLSLLVKGEYESDAVAYSRMLLAYGDVSLQDLARQPESPTVQILIRSLMQLLAYEGFAGADDDICTPAMEFWQSYTEHLIDSLSTTEDQVEPWKESARQCVMQVVEQCWVKVRMPPEKDYVKWTSDAKGEFKVFRTDVVDLLQSAYALVGSSLFDRFASLAVEALQNHAWLHLEATLFCLNALAEPISDEDVVDSTLSTLFNSELFTTMMNETLEVPFQTQQTAVNLITSFTAFFERNTHVLPSMLTFLFDSMRTPALAGVAAKAIQSTCDSCRKSLVSEIGALQLQYDDLSNFENLTSGSRERLVGAIAAVIQAVSSESDKMESFSRLLGNVEVDVQACSDHAQLGERAGAEELGLCALRCLTAMGKYLQEPDDNTVDLESEPIGQNKLYEVTIWTPYQVRILRAMGAVSEALGTNNGDVVEGVCQVFRSGLKSKFPGPFVFAPSVIEGYVVSTSIQSPRLEYVLDTAGAMLSAHTRSGVTKIDPSAARFLDHSFQLLASMSYIPTNEPEVSSSCIELVTKYIPPYLHIFLDPGRRYHVTNFILFTIQSMLCKELMPRRSAAFFWASLFQRYDVKPDIQIMVQIFLEQYGPQVAQAIMINIGGEASRSELETFADPLRQMVTNQVKVRQWLSDALFSNVSPAVFSNTFPSSAKVGDTEKRMFLQQVMKLVLLVQDSEA